MVEAFNKGVTNWAGNIKSLLDKYGFSYVWNNPHAVNLSLSAHQLRIVTERYSHNRIDRSMRLCTLCDRSDIEDEYHFVIICPAYSHLRQQYINSYYYRHPRVYKFVLLMKSTKHQTWHIKK